ncbi:MAG: head-tail adaptor protein [Dehalococcoidia bacterium]
MVRLIHPRMLPSLTTTFYVSLCTIQESTPTRDAGGQPILAWANLAGHVDLECSIAPISPGSPEAAEKHRPDGTIVIATHHLTFASIYTSIFPNMRAVAAGVAFDILSVEHDSHGTMTRLRLEIVR